MANDNRRSNYKCQQTECRSVGSCACTAKIRSSTRESLIFNTTLHSCTCECYQFQHRACKHMIRLATELRLVGEPDYVPQKQKSAVIAPVSSVVDPKIKEIPIVFHSSDETTHARESRSEEIPMEKSARSSRSFCFRFFRALGVYLIAIFLYLLFYGLATYYTMHTGNDSYIPTPLIWLILALLYLRRCNKREGYVNKAVEQKLPFPEKKKNTHINKSPSKEKIVLQNSGSPWQHFRSIMFLSTLFEGFIVNLCLFLAASVYNNIQHAIIRLTSLLYGHTTEASRGLVTPVIYHDSVYVQEMFAICLALILTVSAIFFFFTCRSLWKGASNQIPWKFWAFLQGFAMVAYYTWACTMNYADQYRLDVSDVLPFFIAMGIICAVVKMVICLNHYFDQRKK